MTKARLRFDSDNFVLTNQRGASAQYWAGKGGYSEYRMNVVITKESFEKFATANWEDFDSKKIDKILLSARASPAVSSVARPPP